ncbi:solute carrier family 25 member 40-like [Ischnura elegans]|uniref:solute carrier family 25 member 40-like n=1 Tax=Ischnura elegans TaxID=197161 RepID=UPI001ED87BAC|nr:solute carrier family 25 member 40-like [Ischnura elegans]
MSGSNSKNVFRLDDPRFRITPLQQMGAACTGAFITSLMMTPLDVVKIRLQAQEKAILSHKSFIPCSSVVDHLYPCFNSANCSATQVQHDWFRKPNHLNGTVDAFVKIYKMEGVSSLWSGLSPTLVLSIPATVIYYVAYEQLRVNLKDYYNDNWNKGKPAVQPTWIPLISGASARIWAASIVSPLELVRTKMQSKKLSYSETFQAVRSHLQHHGIPGLWKGLGPTLMRDVPFSAIYWLNYEGLKNYFSQQSPSFSFSFFAGAVSGAIAGILTLPFDVVKTLQQIEIGDKGSQPNRRIRKSHNFSWSRAQHGKSTAANSARKATTAVMMKSIYASTGIKGLFAGFVPRVVKVAPACAIMVATFEYGKQFFEKHNRKMILESTQTKVTAKRRRKEVRSFDIELYA